jgi:toxin CcdB
LPKQFDIWRHRNGQLVMVLQHDLLEELTTRVVAPLVPNTAKYQVGAKGLNPAIELDGQTYHLVSAHLAAVPKTDLVKYLHNAHHLRDDLTRAVDLLFMGL